MTHVGKYYELSQNNRIHKIYEIFLIKEDNNEKANFPLQLRQNKTNVK